MRTTVDDARVHSLARMRGDARSSGRHYLEWWIGLASAGAWALLIVLPHPHPQHAGHGQEISGTLIATAAMVVAMMLPLTIPSIREGVRSAGRRGEFRALTGFLAGYMAVWMVAMIAITGVWTVAVSWLGWTAASVGTVIVAALWEAVTHGRHPAHAWQSGANNIRTGGAIGLACVTRCWALMAVCVAFAHSLPVMFAIFGVQVAGRYGRRQIPGLAVLAVLGIGLAALAVRISSGHG